MSSLVATIVVERILDGLTLVLIFVLLLFMEARRLEQILLQFRRNCPAGVADFQYHAAIIRLPADPDLATGSIVFAGVFEQILQDAIKVCCPEY